MYRHPLLHFVTHWEVKIVLNALMTEMLLAGATWLLTPVLYQLNFRWGGGGGGGDFLIEGCGLYIFLLLLPKCSTLKIQLKEEVFR